MERLTSTKEVSEMNMVELAHNSCFVKDREAWYRDYSVEIDARTLARKLLKDFAEGDDSFTCDEDFDEYITSCLMDGTDSIEGLIALFYRNLWAMAELHAHLKYYEDLEEQGKLMKLPCAMGDKIYEPRPDRGMVTEYRVSGLIYSGGEVFVGWQLNSGIYSNLDGVPANEIGKTVFLTREAAETALKELIQGGSIC